MREWLAKRMKKKIKTTADETHETSPATTVDGGRNLRVKCDEWVGARSDMNAGRSAASRERFVMLKTISWPPANIKSRDCNAKEPLTMRFIRLCWLVDGGDHPASHHTAKNNPRYGHRIAKQPRRRN